MQSTKICRRRDGSLYASIHSSTRPPTDLRGTVRGRVRSAVGISSQPYVCVGCLWIQPGECDTRSMMMMMMMINDGYRSLLADHTPPFKFSSTHPHQSFLFSLTIPSAVPQSNLEHEKMQAVTYTYSPPIIRNQESNAQYDVTLPTSIHINGTTGPEFSMLQNLDNEAVSSRI